MTAPVRHPAEERMLAAIGERIRRERALEATLTVRVPCTEPLPAEPTACPWCAFYEPGRVVPVRPLSGDYEPYNGGMAEVHAYECTDRDCRANAGTTLVLHADGCGCDL